MKKFRGVLCVLSIVLFSSVNTGADLGDINGDENVDLPDAILTLQVLAGTEPSSAVYKEADVNEDGRVGLEEVIYILRQLTLVEPSYFVYVPNVYHYPNVHEAYVSVIDTVTNTVIETIALPYPNGAVAALASSTHVYVQGSSLSVIDTLTNTIIESLPDFYSGFLTLNPTGTHLYTTRASATPNKQDVVVINTATNTVETSIGPITADPQSDYASINDLVVGPSGRYVYVDGTDTTVVSTDPYEFEYSSFIAVIDTDTNTVTKTLPFVWTPERMAVHPSGNFLYVLYANRDLQNRFMAVINTATDQIVKNVDLEYRPIMYLAVHPQGTYVYGSQPSLLSPRWNPGSVVPIDTTTYEMKPAIEVGIEPNGLSVNPSGTRVYVVNENQTQDNGSVSVIDTTTNTVIETIPVGKWPKAVSHQFIGKGS